MACTRPAPGPDPADLGRAPNLSTDLADFVTRPNFSRHPIRPDRPGLQPLCFPSHPIPVWNPPTPEWVWNPELWNPPSAEFGLRNFARRLTKLMVCTNCPALQSPQPQKFVVWRNVLAERQREGVGAPPTRNERTRAPRHRISSTWPSGAFRA